MQPRMLGHRRSVATLARGSTRRQQGADRHHQGARKGGKRLPATNFNLPSAAVSFTQDHIILRQSVFDEQGNFNDSLEQPPRQLFLHACGSRGGFMGHRLRPGLPLTPRYQPNIAVSEGGLGFDCHGNTLATAKKNIL
jgi:hypothetical protein